LAQIFYGVRDSGLRSIAERRGIRVPSLVADTRQTDPVLLQNPDALAEAPPLDVEALPPADLAGAPR
jgi:hypothetical protein